MSGGRFDVCVDKTLGHEGVFSNHVADKAGATKYGITQRALWNAQAEKIVPRNVSIAALTVDQAKRIYFANYWTPARCSEFPAPLDLLLFDARVNHRPTVAARLIQEAIGTVPDGVIGPNTLATAEKLGERPDRREAMFQAIHRYQDARKDFFRALVREDPSQGVFLKGWLRRADMIAAQAAAELVETCSHAPVPA